MISLRRMFGIPDLALDLGTATTRVFAQGQGLIAEEPSAVRLSARTVEGNEVAVEVMPLRGGVVVNRDAAAALLRPLVSRVKRCGTIRPRALACIPTDATERERKALVASALGAGVSAVRIVPEPLAAAIGSGIDIASPYSQMIVDIGHGVTDVAVFRDGALRHTGALRVACSDLQSAVRQWLREHYSIAISRNTAEFLTRSCGVTAAHTLHDEIPVSGYNSVTGRSSSLQIRVEEVIGAQQQALNSITGFVASFLKNLPDGVAAQVIESGIHLTGGGACYPGMAKVMADRVSMEVRVVRDPLHAVIDGARVLLNTPH